MDAHSIKISQMLIPPHELFTRQRGLYSAFDKNGLPTHDASGNEIKQSVLSKLKKEQDLQKRIYIG